MSGHRVLVGLGTLIAAIAVCVTVLFFDIYRPLSTTSGLRVAGTELGDVWLSRNHACQILVENCSNRPVDLLDIKASCTCASVIPRHMTIPAQSKRNLKLVLDLWPRSRGPSIPKSSVYSVNFYPVLSQYRARSPWVVRAQVKSVFRHCPETVELGNVLASHEGVRQVVATFSVGTYSVIKSIDCIVRNTAFSADVKKKEGSDTEFEIAISRTEDLVPGFFRIPVQVRAVSASLPEHGVSLEIFLDGRAIPDISVTPSVVSLGYCWVGETHEEDCTLRSMRGVPFVAHPVGNSRNNESLAVCVDIVPTIGSAAICHLRISPTRPGDIDRTVSIPIVQSGRQALVQIRMLGHALPTQKETK